MNQRRPQHPALAGVLYEASNVSRDTVSKCMYRIKHPNVWISVRQRFPDVRGTLSLSCTQQIRLPVWRGT